MQALIRPMLSSRQLQITLVVRLSVLEGRRLVEGRHWTGGQMGDAKERMTRTYRSCLRWPGGRLESRVRRWRHTRYTHQTL